MRGLRLSLVILVLCALAVPASAATNMYIKFENPAVAGGSTAAGHSGEIEVLSWSHGFTQPTSPTRSGPGEQASHQNLSFTKYIDSSTDDLLKSLWRGKQFGKATLTCYRADGATDNKPVKYLEVVMEPVILVNHSVSGGPGDVPVETYALDYGKVTYTYIDQKGAAQGASTDRPPKKE
jgi:type VI secretion system secreted protein Hcp